MNEIEAFVEWIISIIETVFPPIPSEAVFPLAGYVVLKNNMDSFHVFTVGIAGGSGATLGAFIIYLIALKLGRAGLMKYLKYAKIKETSLNKADKWFEKYGDKSVIFGRLIPGIRELVSIPAGIFKMNYKKFLIFTFIGSTTWSTALTLAGYYFGVATLEFF